MYPRDLDITQQTGSLAFQDQLHPYEVHAMTVDNLPVTAKLTVTKTAKSAKLYTCIHHGTWPSPVPDDLISYFHRKFELTLQPKSSGKNV